MLGEDGILVPYYYILETVDTHHMCWYPCLPDSRLTVPFYLYDTEKAEHLHDVLTGKTKPHKMSKNELIGSLHTSGLASKVRKADIVSKAR